MNSTLKSKCQTILNESGHYHNNNKTNKVLLLAQKQISLLKGQKPKQLFQPNSNFADYLHNNKKNRLSSQNKPKLDFSLDNYKKKVNKRSQSNTNLHTISNCNTLSSPTLVKSPSNFKQQIEIIQKDFKLVDDSQIKKRNNKRQYSFLNSPIHFHRDIFRNEYKNTESENCFNKLITKNPISRIVNDSKRQKIFFDHMKTEYGLEKKKKVEILFKNSNNNIRKNNFFNNENVIYRKNNNIQYILNNLNYNF